MQSAKARLWVVFNGEIYNHRDLRGELIRQHGSEFRTSADTEVILECYRVWGIPGFAKLNGMFAFALWDEEREELVLARDPIGVKPLYWGPYQQGMWFSSELGAALKLEFLPRTISPELLSQYLYYRFVPAPRTLWAEAFKVRPGHALRFDRTGRFLTEYDFAQPIGAPVATNERQIIDALAQALPEAVQRQMMADVPIGAFLSGGLDSSLLVSQMLASGDPISTFAVGFESGPGVANELEAARSAASSLGTSLVEKELNLAAYFRELPAAILAADEPVAHPGMLLQSFVAAVARPHVKVVLTGQGADEPLGGYPRHQALQLARVTEWCAPLLLRDRRVRAYSERNETLGRLLRLLEAGSASQRAFGMFGPVAESEALHWSRGAAGLTPDDLHRPMLYWWNRADGMDPIARALYVDARTSLAEDLLLVGDRMSMRHSLEARVPFLDLDYLNLVERIPGPTRVGLFRSRKHLQHGVARRLLPPELQRRLAPSGRPWRRKVGFSVPVAEWFRTSIADQLTAFVAGPDAVLPNYLHADMTRRRVDAFLSGHGRAYRLPLVLFVLECWLRMNIGGLTPVEVMHQLDGASAAGATRRVRSSPPVAAKV
jgi:asparagine synthase (glutamine-hydrolysing)